jgi:cation transport regulator ChaC
MMIIGITAGGRESGDSPVGKNKVPRAVKEAAMKGLRLSYRNNYGAWNFIGIARAIELALMPAVSDTTTSRMHNYLFRHSKDKAGKNFGNDATPSRGYMAWLNWGGDPAVQWLGVPTLRSNPKTYLFSYGSNSPRQLAERLGHSVKGVGAYAPGMVRAFRGQSRTWGGGVATLICETGGKAFGYIAEVTEADLAILDRYEGAPRNYKQTKVDVVTEDGRKVKAMAYLATSTVKTPPSRAYLEAVAETINTFWSNSDGSVVTWHDITAR